MRRFIVRFLLATLAAWLGSFLLPGLSTDKHVTTYILFGLFIAIGETLIPFAEGLSALLLFFLPRSVRTLGLRVLSVAIAASLVNGFFLSDRPVVPLLGMAVLLTVLYMLPFAH